jgi:Carboxypeptidase regulatory-like domain
MPSIRKAAVGGSVLVVVAALALVLMVVLGGEQETPIQATHAAGPPAAAKPASPVVASPSSSTAPTAVAAPISEPDEVEASLEEDAAPEDALEVVTLQEQAPVAIHGDGPGLVEGLVRDGSGRGLPGVEVILFEFNAEAAQVPEGMRRMVLAQAEQWGGMRQFLSPVESAQTDAEGRFAVGDPALETEDLWLGLAHPERQEALSEVFSAPHIRGVHVDATLPAGTALEVTVLVPPDQEAPDYPQVSLQLEESSRTLAGSPLAFRLEGTATSVERTDDDGPIRVTGIPAGAHTLLVEADGFRPARLPVATSAEDVLPLEVTLDPGLRITGYVVDAEGLPVSGAELWATSTVNIDDWNGGQSVPTASSGEDGAFVLAGLDEAAYQVSATAEGFSQGVAPPVEAGGELTLTLERSITLQGVVVHDGQPAGAGIQVSLTPPDMPWGIQEITTDEEGAFAFAALDAGDYGLRAEGEGLVTLDSLDVHLAQGAEPVTLEVIKGQVLTLTVVDRRTQRPVEGAGVDALTAAQASMRQQMMWGNPDAEDAGPKTDARGVVTLDTLRPGEFTLLVAHPDYADLSTPLGVAPGEALAPRQLELIPAASLHVQLLQADGAPFSGATLILAAQAATGPQDWAMSYTDADGLAEWSRLAPGDYQLSFMDQMSNMGGGMRSLGRVQVAEGASVRQDHRLGDDSSTAIVAGRVLRTGQSSETTSVLIYSADQGFMGGYAWVQTAADGSFESAPLEPGSYIVASPGAPSQTLDLGPGTTQVTLEVRAGTLAGTLVTATGEPALGAHLYLQPLDERARDPWEVDFSSMQGEVGQTDQLGMFSLQSVEPGRYRVVARSKEGVALSEPVTMQANASVTGLGMSLSAGSDLQLRVTRSDGSPASGVAVHVFHEGLGVLGPNQRWMSTPEASSDGTIRLANLVPGTYSIYAVSPSSGRAVARGVSLSAGETTLDLSLEPTGTLEVHAAPGTSMLVRLAGSQAPADPSPFAMMPGLLTAGADGTLQLPDLPAVELELIGRGPAGEDLGPVRVTPSPGEVQAVALD